MRFRLLCLFWCLAMIFSATLCAAAPERDIIQKPAPKPAALKPKAQEVKKPQDKKAPTPKTTPKTAAKKTSDDTPIVSVDVDETIPLPPYPAEARVAMGKMQTYYPDEEDTLLDIARHFNLGFVEARAANPDIDAWAPEPDKQIVIPSFHILPRARQDGIVVNLAEMRLYYFKTPGAEPETFPIGIGRDGLLTPLGETKIVRKAAGPTWYPTARMRKEEPTLPAAVPPGPQNPMGTHALYLSWPEVRIHGSNKPWAIGRRVSSGCMRMYPEDIVKMFNLVPVGSKVSVVEQPILVGWTGGTLYLEAHPSRTQSTALELSDSFPPKDMSEGLRKVIAAAAEDGKPRDTPYTIDWDAAAKAVHERLGYPVAIAGSGAEANKTPPKKMTKKSPVRRRYKGNFNE